MAVNLNSVDASMSYSIPQSMVSTGEAKRENTAPAENVATVGTDKDIQKTANKAQQDADKKLTNKDLDSIAKALDKFMESLNADLRFKFNEKADCMTVQMVRTRDNKVLKEFPPKEFLDMVARIREYVGAILDKKV
jgi:flagellar protein FlaG